MTYQRKVSFAPAYDKRDADPTKNYGIHGANIRFTLVDENQEGMSLVIFTQWHLPHVQKELRARASPETAFMWEPMGADVSIHQRHPRHDGDEPVHHDCDVTGGVCYSDGSTLQADRLLKVLIAEGDEAMWVMLEAMFRTWKRSAAGDTQ